MDLKNSRIFHGMTEKEIEEAKLILSGRTVSYEKNQRIFSEGQKIQEMGIILSGSIMVERIDYQGNRTIIAYNSTGQIFAESYALTGEPLLVDVTANEETHVMFLNLCVLLQGDGTETWRMKLIRNLMLGSTYKNLELSRRSFHTRPKTIRGRVMSFLTEEAKKAGSREFDILLNRQQMADYLNLDRSALSGELSSMQRDGLISFHRKHFVMREAEREG